MNRRFCFGLLFALSWPTVMHAAGAATYVIHISVDGLRGDLVQAAMVEDPMGTPTFHRFVTEGATTFDARTDYDYTITLPNHTSMITGRPVLQPTGRPATLHHGYLANSTPPPTQTLHNSGNPTVPYKASTFDVAHDAGLRTALYASKAKFVLYAQSYDAVHGAPDLVPPDDGTAKIDRYVNTWSGDPETAAPMQATFLADMQADPFHYAFLHYADLDAAGHESGWESVAWRATLRSIDRFLGEILSMIEAHPLLRGRTTVLVTADHGGTGTNHSNATHAAVYTIPFLVWGAGVAPGSDLYTLNATTRAHPGDGRPDSSALPQPIRNGDSGNLALALLGLSAVPGSSLNADQSLVVGLPTALHAMSWSALRRFYR